MTFERARTTASPIRRMNISVVVAGGSLAGLLDPSYPESWVAQSWQRDFIEMKVVCASCEQEGRTSYLGEREPYDNPATTHGLCSRHQEEALEALPSQSFPDAELLIIVGPNDTDLYEYLLQRFAGVRGIKVILERRRTQEAVRNERRIRQGRVSTLGYTVVRFKPRPPPPSASR